MQRADSQFSGLEDASVDADALYSPEQRVRRDESVWTVVQGVLAPLQFLVFLISLGLVLRYLSTGLGHDAAALSVLIKTAFLLAIMVTGSLWERDVFGRYLFAPAFFWEDVVSFGVIALHGAYVIMFAFSVGSEFQQMLVALLAYGAYLINAGQFLWKFRRARLSLADPQLRPQTETASPTLHVPEPVA